MSASPSALNSAAAAARDAASAAAIEVRNVTVRRGENDVLRDISLNIHAGCITAVVGRSGVGKTTLLCLLNGLLRPAKGTIDVADIGTLDNTAALHKHRSQIGVVFQEHALIDRLPAIDNVLLGLADTRHPLSPLPWSEDAVMRAGSALEEVGLLHRANTRVSRLSGGERQRVGIARALVRRPRLLFADEPFASVDRALVRQLSDEFLAAVARGGMTVVIVMHQIETALAIADRVIGLADGAVAFDGAADDFDDAAQSMVFV